MCVTRLGHTHSGGYQPGVRCSVAVAPRHDGLISAFVRGDCLACSTHIPLKDIHKYASLQVAFANETRREAIWQTLRWSRNCIHDARCKSGESGSTCAHLSWTRSTGSQCRAPNPHQEPWMFHISLPKRCSSGVTRCDVACAHLSWTRWTG